MGQRGFIKPNLSVKSSKDTFIADYFFGDLSIHTLVPVIKRNRGQMQISHCQTNENKDEYQNDNDFTFVYFGHLCE